MTNPRIGRPPSITDPDELYDTLEAYFDKCDSTPITRQHVTGKGITLVTTPTPYTMAGLALAIGISRETLNQYRHTNHPWAAEKPDLAKKFSDILTHARQRIEVQNLTHAMVGCYDSKIASLNLSSNYKYSTSTDVKLEGSVTLEDKLRDLED